MIRASRTDPWVIAHRGASADFPENTRIAFDEALRQGCDGIELDVQLSRDGVPVVYHDRTLARAGGGQRRVAELDLAELGTLDAGAWLDNGFRGEHIACLEEILERYGDRTQLLVEIKSCGRDAELASAVAAMVQRMELDSSVMILSFDMDVLDVCAQSAPDLRRVLNLKPPPSLSPSLERLLSRLFALSADIRTLTPRFGAEVRSRGRELLTYTCNDVPEVDRALDAGALAIMSDRPGWLAHHLLGRRGRDAT